MVGDDHTPLVIAEIGINHEGSLPVAIAMVDAAIDAGAEVIKHQTHVVEDEMSDEAKSVIPGNADVSIYEIMERCALSESDEKKLMDYVQSRGAIFISTPFSRAAAERLARFDIAAFKIGSGECNNYPLIKHVAKYGKPMIVSTGMNTLESVRPTVEIMRKAGVPFALLHCTNVYPTPPELVRLGAMQELKQAYPDAVVGLSDHTVSNHVCLGAVALGASILERHFTDRMDRPGPDILCSMDPSALSDLVHGSATIFKARGAGKGPVEAEAPTIAFAFASVVAYKAIGEGETLTEDNLWLRRPGTGDFGPTDYEPLLGRVAARSIKAGAQIRKDDLR
ncbi:N-acetylneuraminate synthase NeuB [Herbaspirillum seropedicae]|nr:N-acetylneuraminate synthase NeuB [Herbaspirillum seropedicae]